MNGADIAILVVVLISSGVGLFRGFVKEVLSLATWIVALVLAWVFSTPLGQALPLDPDLSPALVQIIGGVLVFVLALIAGGILTHLISGLVVATGLTGTDRTLGAVFGLGRGLAVVLAILIFLPAIAPVDEAGWWQASLLIPQFLAFEGWAMEVLNSLSEWISQLFRESV